jgi:hypothetical protein
VSYTAMWRNRNLVSTCTSDTHSCGYTTGNTWRRRNGGIDNSKPIPKGYCEYGTFRVIYRNINGVEYPKSYHIHSPEYGMIMTIEEANALNRERGYSVPYGRNVCNFVQSRAARKRGYSPQGIGKHMYENRVLRYQEKMAQQQKNTHVV